MTTLLLSEWKKFVGAKFQRPTADADRSLENLVAEEDVLGYDELGVCLKALRSGKVTGCDNVPIEAYRGSVHATNELFRICRMMWHSERIPPELVRGTFIMLQLHKKGPRDDMANYRAICLLCHSYKLLSAVMARRLMVVLEDRLPDTQAGFRPARACRDNVCALRWFINMVLREGRQTREFTKLRGLKMHMAHWCDGGRTQRSRVGSLTDKAVKSSKRRTAEASLDKVVIGSDPPLENVPHFKYLGSRLQGNGSDVADVDHRLEIAQSAFSSLSHLWADHRLSRTTKLRMPADKMVRCALMALVSDTPLCIQRAACSVTARALRCHNLWQWRRIVQCGAPKWRRCRELALF